MEVQERRQRWRTVQLLAVAMLVVGTAVAVTVREFALELRCSLPHVYNVINEKVKNVPRLPAIAVGRRKLIQRDTLEDWKKINKRGDDDVIIPPTKIDAVRRMEEDLYA